MDHIIEAMIDETRQIQKELEVIADELMEFKGIGSEICSRLLYETASEYQQLGNQLKK
ncbi:hypothetical protein [Acetobacterium sp.]|uniref:hypothetical protein n=1 Tax=Acetobacterium sp. TaxID=1872094 RepID=UPI0035930C49